MPWPDSQDCTQQSPGARLRYQPAFNQFFLQRKTGRQYENLRVFYFNLAGSFVLML